MVAVLNNRQTRSRAIKSIVRVGRKGKRKRSARIGQAEVEAELRGLDSRAS